MGSYLDTAVQELEKANDELKAVQNVIDSIIADYDEVPNLHRHINKYEMYGINENVAKAQTALHLILTDIHKAKENKNG